MTNREKFKKVFGFDYESRTNHNNAPIVCEWHMCGECPIDCKICDIWWEQEYSPPYKKNGKVVLEEVEYGKNI